MRIIAACLVSAAVAALASPAIAQSFVGEWTATAAVPGAEVKETLAVTQNEDGAYSIMGALLPGMPGADQPQAGPGTDVVLEGDSFSYKRAIPGAGLVLEYAGTVDGDTFTGTATVAGVSIPYTGVRN